MTNQDDLKLAAGQTWRNKKTQVQTVIISAGSGAIWNSYVVHQSKRLTHTSRTAFFKKYEQVTE